MADSMGGFDSIAVIDTEAIREVLRRTMVMAMPNEDSEKPAFVFERQVSFDQHDNEGNPWDWTAAPALETAQASVQVITAYEFSAPLGRQGAFLTEVGEFTPTTVVFTMFEDEFAEIRGFSYATVGPSAEKWYFRFWKPSVSLNDMTVYEVVCVATGVE